MMKSTLPPVVSQAEWQAARDQLLVKEKAHTRASDVIAAERRRLPMVETTNRYIFDGENGKASLLDLFEGRSARLRSLRPSADAAGGCDGDVDHAGQ